MRKSPPPLAEMQSVDKSEFFDKVHDLLESVGERSSSDASSAREHSVFVNGMRVIQGGSFRGHSRPGLIEALGICADGHASTAPQPIPRHMPPMPQIGVEMPDHP